MSRYSPAALALMRDGVAVSRVADALGKPPRTVSRWLAGLHPAPPELFGAVAALGSPELADEVRSLIPERATAVPS